MEIETYPDPDADKQVWEDLMLIRVDRKIIPEVVSLVLKPKGKLAVAGAAEEHSPRGGTRLSGSWPVVRLWELEAETLLNAADVGLIPWVPLTKTALAPEELMTRCRDRLAQVPDKSDRGLDGGDADIGGVGVPGQAVPGFVWRARSHDRIPSPG